MSAVLELIEPSPQKVSIWWACDLVIFGAVVFAALDDLVKHRWGSGSGGGLLAAITLDGLPENLALGVALIGTGPLGAAALSGSILLSSLPEASGGARERAGGRSNRSVLLPWIATAVLLSAAAVAGHLLLTDAPEQLLALIRFFAGGPVVGSLAIEVFPKGIQGERLCDRTRGRARTGTGSASDPPGLTRGCAMTLVARDGSWDTAGKARPSVAEPGTLSGTGKAAPTRTSVPRLRGVLDAI